MTDECSLGCTKNRAHLCCLHISISFTLTAVTVDSSAAQWLDLFGCAQNVPLREIASQSIYPAGLIAARCCLALIKENFYIILSKCLKDCGLGRLLDTTLQMLSKRVLPTLAGLNGQLGYRVVGAAACAYLARRSSCYRLHISPLGYTLSTRGLLYEPPDGAIRVCIKQIPSTLPRWLCRPISGTAPNKQCFSARCYEG